MSKDTNCEKLTHSPARLTLAVLTVALRSTHDTVKVESNKPTYTPTVSADSMTPRHVVVSSLDDSTQLQQTETTTTTLTEQQQPLLIIGTKSYLLS